ncbi:hypothetical protein JCM8097_006396 [Rhodosporidiobolus ruineniae]
MSTPGRSADGLRRQIVTATRIASTLPGHSTPASTLYSPPAGSWNGQSCLNYAVAHGYKVAYITEQGSQCYSRM